ncbi:hypothetical protein BKA59DRAFT_470990 [Fusarium tricinctum]|uniref:Secreted protein n=1 Tax=Fusarium tricinctum TaxID=61284 RepID=A0A8K0S9E3_9HYPO|nr:hypothetical protein BKA59DRAFT_470990 [Fusarium tricinctum]
MRHVHHVILNIHLVPSCFAAFSLRTATCRPYHTLPTADDVFSSLISLVSFHLCCSTFYRRLVPNLCLFFS